jgi:hypothetical protein
MVLRARYKVNNNFTIEKITVHNLVLQPIIITCQGFLYGSLLFFKLEQKAYLSLTI